MKLLDWLFKRKKLFGTNNIKWDEIRMGELGMFLEPKGSHATDPFAKPDPLPNHILNNLCLYCDQKYREIECKWRDGTRAGCSCCGAPKG